MKEIVNQQTKLSKSNASSRSIKTTIPAPILQLLKLNAGNKIRWKALIDDNEQIHITIEKIEENK